MDNIETVSLKEFFEALLTAQNLHSNARFDALDKAIALSREELNRRLEGLNQLRNEVITDRNVFMKRESCEDKHKELSVWRDTVNKKLTTLETRSITWTAAVGIFFLILNIVMKWLGK
jgi:hypothetical protein